MGSEGPLIKALNANMKTTIKRLNSMKMVKSYMKKKKSSDEEVSEYAILDEETDGKDADKVSLSLLQDVTYLPPTA